MGIARQRWLVLALQLFLILAPTVTPKLAPKVVEPAEEDDDEELQEQYLYDVDGGVVIDYMPSAGEADPVKPGFLYSANNGPRIVEFYAPWCPHCQSFREEFIHFAGQMVEGARSVGVDLKVHAISCEVHKTLCKNWEMIGFPQLRLFRAGEFNYTGQALYYHLKPNSVFKHLHIPAYIDMTEENNKKRAPPVNAQNYERTQEDIFNDAHLSFHFALRNGVFMTNGPLPFKNRVALEDWLNLLHRTIPPTSSMHPLVSALREDFEDLVEDEDIFMEMVSRYPPPQKRWSVGCTHGRKGAGYTCGLWELFHIVTVGVAEWNQLALVDLSMAIGVEDAAVTIRNYVEHFFGCEVCRMNFVSAFDSCAHDRCRRLDNNATSMSAWMELPLWLFETHNTVNARLLREKGGREGFTPTLQDGLDRQWPARDACPQCWREDNGWVESSVVEHLRLEYWPEPTAYLLKRRRQIYKIAKREIDAYARLPGAASKLDDSDEDIEDNSEEAKLHIQNEQAEEIDGIDGKSEDVNLDDDVTRKDIFYNTEEDGNRIADSRSPPAIVGFSLFIVFMVGLAVTWYSRKMQRRRSGLRKKLDAYR